MMFMMRFTLFALVLFATKVSSHLPKCCPPGQIFSGYSKMGCVPVPNGVMDLYVLHLNDTMKFQGLPRCDKPDDIMTTPLNSLRRDDFLETQACLEVLHDQIAEESTIVVVHCRSNKDGQEKTNSASLPRLAYIRKCCSRNAIFDRRTKACVPSLDSPESIITLLPNDLRDKSIVAVQGPPECDGPIVDYEINKQRDTVTTNKTSLDVKARNTKQTLVATESNSCFETMLDSMSNPKLVVRVCRDSTFCNRNACIRKCCAENEFFYAGGCKKYITPEEPMEFYHEFAKALNETELSTFDTSKDYGVMFGKPCKYGMFPMIPREEIWSLTSKGHVLTEKLQDYDQNGYCMDVFYNSSQFKQDFYVFICFQEPAVQEYFPIRYQVNTALEITSCVFLLMTLLVYLCLPSLQNLHGKTLMCHIGSLFLAFTCLAIIPWINVGDTYEDEKKAKMVCTVLGYSMLFCFLSSFLWLNIMCFDIWWTFGGMRGSVITKKHGHRRRFLLYCLYAWGLAFVVSILAIIADRTDILPVYLQPGIGHTSCWFTQKPDFYGELTFFVGPVTIQLISNIIFFILTSVYCNKIKLEIKRLTADPSDPRSKRYHSDRSKFVMNMKLFIVMGISWIFEIVSFFLKRYFDYFYWQHMFFYVSDVFNCLQGLLIFILFVIKKRVYIALRKRLGLKDEKKPMCNVSTTMQDPYKVNRSTNSSSSSTTTSFAVNSTP